MFSKDKDAKKLAVDEYFKHFDNKTAAAETAEDREVRVSLGAPIILTRRRVVRVANCMHNCNRHGQRSMPP